MGNRTWIKIYCEKWLKGTLREESSELRGVWMDLLALAGNGSYGDSGEIKLGDNIGLQDEQIAGILKVPLENWQQNKARLIETQRIEITSQNIIKICNWIKYQSEYQRQKGYREESPESKLNYRMSQQIYASLKDNKAGRHWETLVNYTLQDLKNSLEKQFTKGMSWENFGNWHIDHIIPQSSFKFQTHNDLEFKKCWALENLQPLWAYDNLSKANKVGLQRGVTTWGYNVGCGEIEKEKEIEIEKEKKKKEKTLSPVSQDVIVYLNEKLGTSYKTTTRKTQDLIRVRQKEGFTLEDFKKVIDKKVKQWKTDTAMSKYLRPETLFGTKFESYLNEPKAPWEE